jgi:hypothetical protein
MRGCKCVGMCEKGGGEGMGWGRVDLGRVREMMGS